ncbi:class I SAM-dependent methyltransferase [Candidatus Micrarchaeota archaeon]|nr:class I SAM-dependent methyltransferase [Candidatus Micrarchaeota archaeon]
MRMKFNRINWDEYFTKFDWDTFIKKAHPLLKEFYNKELEYIGKISGDALEIGCGTGRVLKVLAKNCKKVVGVDESQFMGDKAKRITKHFKNVEIYKQNAKKMKFKDCTFDAILCLANTFGNQGKDKEKALREMKRVSKKGGKIIISVFNEKALGPRLESYKNAKLKSIKITRTGTVYSGSKFFSEQFTKNKLEKLFQKNKLKCKIVDFTPISYLCICKK